MIPGLWRWVLPDCTITLLPQDGRAVPPMLSQPTPSTFCAGREPGRAVL